MRKSSKLLNIIFIFLLISSQTSLKSTLDFANRSSAIVLANNSSKFRVKNIDNVKGWAEHSLIKASGNDNSWITSNTTYGYSGGEIIPSTYLVYSNSNAIVAMDQKVKNNSNAIIKLVSTDNEHNTRIINNSNAIVSQDLRIKNNSNTIIKLVSTDNEYNIRIINNSNAIVTMDQKVKNNSNAIIKLVSTDNEYNTRIINNSNAIVSQDLRIKNNSDAIIKLVSTDNEYNTRIINNSNAIVSQDLRIKNNSDAIIKLKEASTDLIRYTSNAVVSQDIRIRYNSNAIIKQDVSIVRLEVETAHFVSQNNANLYIFNGLGMQAVDRMQESLYIPGSCMICSPIDLNYGTLILGGDMKCSSQTTLESSGYISPSGHAIILDGDLIVPAGIEINFTTSGVIDGNGHNLIFEEGSKFSLDSFVTLTFRNIKIQNVKNYGDNTSSIFTYKPWRSQLVLQDATLFLSSDYSFTLGELYIHGDIKISGTSQFNYTSTKNAFITKNSSLTLDLNSSFSYGPVGTDSRDLILMEDASSIFYLKGGTLKSTTTGLRLTKGTFLVDHKSYLVNEDGKNGPAKSLSQAISLGGAGNDNLNIEFLPGGNIELLSGILDYRNID